MPSTKPLILCVHGGGTSGAIFHAQLRNIRSRLQEDYEFIFVNAPREGPAGPGVLPLFANSGPYYWWFGTGWNRSTKPGSRPGSSDELDGASLMESSVIQSLTSQGRTPEDVVGLLSFSEGALASTLLLWRISLTSRRDYIGQPSAWQRLRFAVLLCPGYRSDVVQLVGPESIQIPSVQLHGLRDPLLPGSRELMQCYRDDGTTQLVEFDGGHHVPTAAVDLDRLVAAIQAADRRGLRGKRKSPAKTGTAPVGRSLNHENRTLQVSVQTLDRKKDYVYT